jgi:hypothetical protein
MGTVIAKNQLHRVSICWVVSIVPGSPVSNLLALFSLPPTRLNLDNRGSSSGRFRPRTRQVSDFHRCCRLQHRTSGTPRDEQSQLDAIKNTCREYIQNTLAQQFEAIVRAALVDSNIDVNGPNVVIDADDADGQSLLFWYPSVTAGRDSYIRPQ